MEVKCSVEINVEILVCFLNLRFTTSCVYIGQWTLVFNAFNSNILYEN